MEKFVTCIECPRGCSLLANVNADGEITVSGNLCPRGAVYAKNECTRPKRTVTSTVICADGTLLPCKTKEPIPKEKIFDVMAEINGFVAPNSVKIGDILIQNVAKTGVSVVATANKTK